jgi:hypothetical protein
MRVAALGHRDSAASRCDPACSERDVEVGGTARFPPCDVEWWVPRVQTITLRPQKASSTRSALPESAAATSESLHSESPERACFDDAALAALHTADNADPKRVGEYINSIMRYNFEQEVRVSACCRGQRGVAACHVLCAGACRVVLLCSAHSLPTHLRRVCMNAHTQGLHSPRGTSMVAQTDITEKFRAILVDWLVEVHLKFKLCPETLYLAIVTVDRFLEKIIITRTNLQLVGIASLLIAAKYEEIFAPAVRDLVFVSARAYTKEEILRMEGTILSALRFSVTVPTTLVFLQRFLRAVDADTRLTNLASYYAERMLQEYSMLRHLPSTVAASALFLARKALRDETRGGDEWVRVASCVVVSCRVVSRRVASCRVASCRVVSRRVVSRRVVSCRVASCRVVSCRVVSRRVACRVMRGSRASRGVCCLSRRRCCGPSRDTQRRHCERVSWRCTRCCPAAPRRSCRPFVGSTRCPSTAKLRRFRCRRCRVEREKKEEGGMVLHKNSLRISVLPVLQRRRRRRDHRCRHHRHREQRRGRPLRC